LAQTPRTLPATPLSITPAQEIRVDITDNPDPNPPQRDIHRRRPAPPLPEGEHIEDPDPSRPVHIGPTT
jgi:hypothetical protein